MSGPNLERNQEWRAWQVQMRQAARDRTDGVPDICRRKSLNRQAQRDRKAAREAAMAGAQPSTSPTSDDANTMQIERWPLSETLPDYEEVWVEERPLTRAIELMNTLSRTRVEERKKNNKTDKKDKKDKTDTKDKPDKKNRCHFPDKTRAGYTFRPEGPLSPVPEWFLAKPPDHRREMWLMTRADERQKYYASWTLPGPEPPMGLDYMALSPVPSDAFDNSDSDL